MSLSDYLRYLRALNGGLTPWEIAEGSGVSAREVHLIEVKHKRMGDNDVVLQNLASFFSVPVEEFSRRREAYRKRLTSFLSESSEHTSFVVLKLESGEEIGGTIAWFAREAVALEPVPDSGDGNNNLYIVQRSWIADWRRADTPQWEIS